MLTALILSAALQSVPHSCGTANEPAAIAEWNAWANSRAAGHWYGRTVEDVGDVTDRTAVAVLDPSEAGRVWISEGDGALFLLRPRSECDSGRGYSAALIDAESGEVLETTPHLTLVSARYRPVVLTDGARRD
jgi:hypothetical protein